MDTVYGFALMDLVYKVLSFYLASTTLNWLIYSCGALKLYVDETLHFVLKIKYVDETFHFVLKIKFYSLSTAR